MTKSHNITLEAKRCHTRQAWCEFFERNRQSFLHSKQSKHISEIFKILKNDNQSKHYDPFIYGLLIEACLSAWDLKLGKKVYDFYKPNTSPKFAIPAAKLHLEIGQPQKSKLIIQKTLRLKEIAIEDFAYANILLISAYTEEGKNKKSISLLQKLREQIQETKLPPKDEADIKNQIARVFYFFGKYQHAAQLFEESAVLFKSLNDWDSAAKAYFNTACSEHNMGHKHRSPSFENLKLANDIAAKHDLIGPQAHIESFYGLDAYNIGSFDIAIKHFKKANRLTPESDDSYRKLHILSMLMINYFITGKYSSATKLAKETFQLAESDKSNRQRTRYLSLRAELYWEEGKIKESIDLSNKILLNLKTKNIQTLEELYSYAKYLQQAAILGSTDESLLEFKIDDVLKENNFNWLEFLCAKTNFLIQLKKFNEAGTIVNTIISEANTSGNSYHAALGKLLELEILIQQRELDIEFAELKATELEASLAKLSPSPLDAKLILIKSALKYRSGQFSKCIKLLKSAQKSNRIRFADNFVIDCWIKTAEGKSSKLTSSWQEKILSQKTRKYFNPTIFITKQNTVSINNVYVVDFSNHPTLFELVKYLYSKKDITISASDIQLDVWKQSLKTQGWQQKIRNSIMRLRSMLHYTLAPLIIQKDNEVFLFTDAISLDSFENKKPSREDLICQLLKESPMTSNDLGISLNTSPATTKRALKKLVECGVLSTTKIGRRVLYTHN